MAIPSQNSTPATIHGVWQSRWTFILAATGSAVGLGNIWKFPYIAGENGGGAFVILYLFCIALVGVPIMLAEVLLGRRGRLSPINSMIRLCRESNASPAWSVIGWSGVVAGLLIFSFYSVIAGWALHYVIATASGHLTDVTPAVSGAYFDELLQNKTTLITFHSIFMAITLGIVAAGVVKGLGKAVSVLMPMLFVLLLALLLYSAVAGDFAAGVNFLFGFNVGSLSGESILAALGHAFFTMSLGMGAIMVYGAYMPSSAPLGKTVLMVASLDTIISLVAGLIIFPIVFANPGIEPGEGPGLLFVSLPVAFANMPFGLWVGVVFFLLVSIAALSSAISLIEPGVAWLAETKGVNRLVANLFIGGGAWVLGFGTIYSFNDWSGPEYQLFGRTFFDSLDFLTASIMLPLGGALIALFVGWGMKPHYVLEELGSDKQRWVSLWFFCVRFISPLLVLLVFVKLIVDNIA